MNDCPKCNPKKEPTPEQIAAAKAYILKTFTSDLLTRLDEVEPSKNVKNFWHARIRANNDEYIRVSFDFSWEEV